jgi:hypothetical protein
MKLKYLVLIALLASVDLFNNEDTFMTVEAKAKGGGGGGGGGDTSDTTEREKNRSFNTETVVIFQRLFALTFVPFLSLCFCIHFHCKKDGS